MYVVRKKIGEVLHIDYREASGPVQGRDLYEAFDPETMEVGWTQKSFIPMHFRISEDGMIIELTLDEQVSKGVFEVPPAHKLVGGRLVSKTTEELVEDNLITLEQIKAQMLQVYSDLSFRERTKLIPDHKLGNASLGIYDEETTDSFRKTVAAFRDEFYRLKGEIEKARDYQELAAVTPQFPTELLKGK